MKDYRTEALRQKLVAAGIDPEKFDIAAHVDRKLSQSENLNNLLSMHGKQNRHTAPIKTTKTQRRQARLGSFYQIGVSHLEIDRHLRAKDPGRRKSASGHYYTERRKNRSDRPGTMI